MGQAVGELGVMPPGRNAADSSRRAKYASRFFRCSRKAPRHGYELMKTLETRSGGAYKVSAGTMYPSLAQLEDEGLIVSEQKAGRRVYQLTESGRKELEREKATADRIWRRASQWEDWGQWMSPGVAMISGSMGP